MKNSSLITTVNTAFRKGVRKGLGMKSRDSISERLEGMFQEASYKIKNLQILFMRRAIVSRNSLTRGLAWLMYRNCNADSVYLEFGNLFAVSYKGLQTLVS